MLFSCCILILIYTQKFVNFEPWMNTAVGANQLNHLHLVRDRPMHSWWLAQGSLLLLIYTRKRKRVTRHSDGFSSTFAGIWVTLRVRLRLSTLHRKNNLVTNVCHDALTRALSLDPLRRTQEPTLQYVYFGYPGVRLWLCSSFEGGNSNHEIFVTRKWRIPFKNILIWNATVSS